MTCGWREELIPYTNNKKELELLENGPKSLAQSWHMNALYQKWKRIKGIPPDPEPPNCQSSLQEWEDSIKKYKDQGIQSLNRNSMDYDIKSWYELYEQNDKLEGMIIIYQQEIEKLELEKNELKEEILFLKQQLEIQSTEEDINKD